MDTTALATAAAYIDRMEIDNDKLEPLRFDTNIEDDMPEELKITIHTLNLATNLILKNKINHVFYNSQDNGIGKTLLMKCVELQCYQGVELLCQQETLDINYQNNEDETALSYSLMEDDYDVRIVECLLKHGANPNIGSPQEKNLLRALYNGFSLEAFWLLVRYGANLNIPDEPNVMGICIMEGRLDVVARLLHYGADPNVPNQYGVTPMGNASYSKYPEVIPLLLIHSANPTHIQGNNENIIMMAAQSGSYRVLKSILNLISVEYTNHLYYMLRHRDHDGKTALIHAIQSGSVKKVRLLIQYAIDINHYPSASPILHPLGFAFRSRNIKILRALFKANIDMPKQILDLIKTNKMPLMKPFVEESIRYFQRKNMNKTLAYLRQRRILLIQAGMPFDIAVQISQTSAPETYISDHIKEIDLKRAASLYRRNKF